MDTLGVRLVRLVQRGDRVEDRRQRRCGSLMGLAFLGLLTRGGALVARGLGPVFLMVASCSVSRGARRPRPFRSAGSVLATW
jgi:hypothetical protein